MLIYQNQAQHTLPHSLDHKHFSLQGLKELRVVWLWSRSRHIYPDTRSAQAKVHFLSVSLVGACRHMHLYIYVHIYIYI